MFDLNFIITLCMGSFAIFEFSKRKKLEALSRQNAWSLYRDSSVILAALQKLENNFGCNNGEKIEYGKIMGFAESMMVNQIRQINSMENITSKKITKWFDSKRICHESHKDIFSKFADK